MTTDRVAGLALAAVALFTLWESRVLPFGSLAHPGPAFVPVMLALLLLGFGALVAALGGGAPRLAGHGWHGWRHAVAILGVCVFCAIALERLGYRVTLALAVGFLLGVVERKRPVPTAVTAVALALGSYFVFATLLRVPLPRGPFGI